MYFKSWSTDIFLHKPIKIASVWQQMFIQRWVIWWTESLTVVFPCNAVAVVTSLSNLTGSLSPHTKANTRWVSGPVTLVVYNAPTRTNTNNMYFHHEAIKYDMHDFIVQRPNGESKQHPSTDDTISKVTQIIRLFHQQEWIYKKIMMLVRAILITSYICSNLEIATANVDSLSLVEESALAVDMIKFCS